MMARRMQNVTTGATITAAIFMFVLDPEPVVHMPPPLDVEAPGIDVVHDCTDDTATDSMTIKACVNFIDTAILDNLL